MPLERGAPDISAYHAAQKPGFWPRLLPEEIEISQLSRLGAQWTHLFGSNVEGDVNCGFVQSFANHSGIVATVTGDGLVVPTTGNQNWFEYGGRLGFRITKGWVADLFVNGTLGPQPVSRGRFSLICVPQLGYVQLDHLQYGLHRPLCARAIRAAKQFRQH